MNYREAELITIGGLVWKPENLDKVGALSARDFSDPVFAKTFSLLEELHHTEGMPCDLVTVRSMLKSTLGDSDFNVLQAAVEDDISANESLPYWATEVRKGRIEREIKEMAGNGAGIDSSRLESLLGKLTVLGRPEVIYWPLNQVQSARAHGVFFKTGFLGLDRVLRFGPGHVMVVAGKSGLGKSSLGFQLLFNMSFERPVGMISIEMTKEEVHDRVENSFNSIPKNLFVSDPSSCGSNDFRAICKTQRDEQKVEIILLDYLQLMREKQDYRNRHLEISHIIRRIKETAKELKLAVVVISQISRNIDARGRGAIPGLSDLKESGDIEYAADEVLFLHQPQSGDEDYRGDNVKLILIGKNRWGRAGKIKVYWNDENTKFGDFYSESSAEGD